MNVLIVENDPLVVIEIQSNLELLGYKDITNTDTVETAITLINERKPDVVLVDIELNSEKTGIELGKFLQKKSIPFIYLSDIQDLNTFQAAKETCPSANLPKPVLPLHLRNALLEIDFKRKENPISPFISINKNGRRIKVRKDQIIYLKAARNNCDLFLKEERHTSSTPMNFVMETLDKNIFVQVHRSYVVNLFEVESWRGNEIFLKNLDEIIPLTDTFRSNFQERFDSV